RTSGPDRYLTALKAAVVFMEKTKKEKLDTVVLACGTNFADALAGSYLAAVKNAPILLIDDNKQATTVENFIKENIVEGGLVYILGGDKAVAPKFESDLKNAGLTVKRLKGDTRYETNIEILKEAGIQGDTILVSVGTNFADSLSASATGLPVLLVKDSLTKVQKDFLKEYKGKKIYILGGTSAVNKTVEGEMGEYGTVKRVQGETRYETSTKIAETFFPETDTVLLAVGDNFPDGLCGGALAYQLHAPVILTKEGNVSFAKKYVARNNITKAVVLGGVNAQKDTLVNDIMGRDPKAEIKEYE
ncbi:MAG: cell wall-binding repeat-containing protein, partial [Erysipelotrichaceae bacterium]|nr:cell wall-binding repeat-containing protein [Erysipelotrichaceae bacterium]